MHLERFVLTGYIAVVNKIQMQKNAKKYDCDICDFRTSNKCNYNKHLLTAKHQSLTFVNKNNSEEFVCDKCSKNYKSRVGLWSHNKKCSVKDSYIPIIQLSQSGDDDVEMYCLSSSNNKMILEIIKENHEFKNMLVEQSKQVLDLQKENNVIMKENKEIINKMVEITQHQLTAPTCVTNNNNTTHNNQNNFNLNLFLNETCKDAMNIQEFLENIKITFEELLTIENAGFVNGISDIFMKRLRDLEVTKRPIHCTDVKRETIYLKECNAWNKDDKDNTKLKDVIEKIEKKNVVSLHQWCIENPDSRINNTPNNLLRDKIFYQTLQGDERTRDKIIKNIAKEVMVNRDLIRATESLNN